MRVARGVRFGGFQRAETKRDRNPANAQFIIPHVDSWRFFFFHFMPVEWWTHRGDRKTRNNYTNSGREIRTLACSFIRASCPSTPKDARGNYRVTPNPVAAVGNPRNRYLMIFFFVFDFPLPAPLFLIPRFRKWKRQKKKCLSNACSAGRKVCGDRRTRPNRIPTAPVGWINAKPNACD